MEEFRLPVIVIHGITILPGMIMHFDLHKPADIKAVEKAFAADESVLILTGEDQGDQEAVGSFVPAMDNILPIGLRSRIKQLIRMPGGVTRVLVEGNERAEILDLENGPDGRVFADARIVSEGNSHLPEEISMPASPEDELRYEAMLRELKEKFTEYCVAFPKVGENVLRSLQDLDRLDAAIDRIALQLPLGHEDRQAFLMAKDLDERFGILMGYLTSERDIARIRQEIAVKLQEKMDENQRNYILREQMSYLQEELEDEEELSEIGEMRKTLEELEASEEVKEKIEKAISRYEKLGFNNSEASVERGYIETLLELPWDKTVEENKDLLHAEQVLEEDHYGLEKVKERVMEFLAVRARKTDGKAPILCLVGPPGTGKTSVVKSIARALELPYERICLGGVRDEAEIRGHRKTYIGAMPGRLIHALKQAKTSNPVMLLDEIDKVGSDYKGDPASALLEVLDSEQNVNFNDHYVEIPVDLSRVLFIATANTTDTIPRPLLDRMEIIEVTSYTANEKFHIAKDYLVPKELEENGLTGSEISFADAALRQIIQSYTKESGVRELQRKIGAVCRKAAWKSVKEGEKKHHITKSNLETYLGKEKYLPEKRHKKPLVGIVRGLAWTAVGGVTLEVEVNVVPGSGKLEITGQLGDVMKESAQIAMNYTRSVAGRFHVPDATFKKNDFHVHIPEGAVQKDGPSAGITMTTAFISAVTKTPVRADLAMTGEVTLRGRVLPIGGLKEKLLAAKTVGIKEVLVPLENTGDVAEISSEIKEGMEISYVTDMKEVLEHALVKGRNSAR